MRLVYKTPPYLTVSARLANPADYSGNRLDEISPYPDRFEHWRNIVRSSNSSASFICQLFYNPDFRFRSIQGCCMSFVDSPQTFSCFNRRKLYTFFCFCLSDIHRHKSGYNIRIFYRNRNRNLRLSTAPLKRQMHKGTSLFTSAATNQRGSPEGSPW